MNNYFVWFKLNGNASGLTKSKRSAEIHNFLFKYGKKLTTKSNAFFYKSDKNVDEISNIIKNYAANEIKLFVIKVSNNYQGWLDEEKWKFLEKKSESS